LGNEYVVKSSIGHIRDLPTSGSASASKEPAAKRGKAAAGEVPALSPKEKARKQLVARMGVDPDHGWKAKYEILPGKEKVIEELRRLAKDADTIYLSTKSPRRRSRKPSHSQASWTSIVSTPSRRGVSSTAWWVTWSRRCCGPRSPVACPPVACNR
jgi:hypothetical protein